MRCRSMCSREVNATEADMCVRLPHPAKANAAGSVRLRSHRFCALSRGQYPANMPPSGLTARRHVDLLRVCSAICLPA